MASFGGQGLQRSLPLPPPSRKTLQPRHPEHMGASVVTGWSGERGRWRQPGWASASEDDRGGVFLGAGGHDALDGTARMGSLSSAPTSILVERWQVGTVARSYRCIYGIFC